MQMTIHSIINANIPKTRLYYMQTMKNWNAQMENTDECARKSNHEEIRNLHAPPQLSESLSPKLSYNAY